MLEFRQCEKDLVDIGREFQQQVDITGGITSRKRGSASKRRRRPVITMLGIAVLQMPREKAESNTSFWNSSSGTFRKFVPGLFRFGQPPAGANGHTLFPVNAQQVSVRRNDRAGFIMGSVMRHRLQCSSTRRTSARRILSFSLKPPLSPLKSSRSLVQRE